ncbi:MAG TPA: hypothetical protein P5244_10110 [Syntrophales bacterium]|nr:hypothetical protein [Syntrophales bacterium]
MSDSHVMERGIVGHDYVVSYQNPVAGRHVDRRTVLYARSFTDCDRPEVTPDDGTRRYHTVCADGNVSDDDGLGVDEGVGGNHRPLSVEFIERHGCSNPME